MVLHVSNVVKVDEKKRDAFIKDIEKKHDALPSTVSR
jgi:hypothetical protein